VNTRGRAIVLEQLELLLELQKIDSDLSDLIFQSESIPVRIEQLEAEKSLATSARDEKQAALEEAQKEHRKRERDLEDANARINDLTAKQLAIKTNAEYAALTHEIEFARQEMADIEAATFKLLEDIETLGTEAQKAADDASESEQKIDAQIIELRGRMDELNDQLAVRKDERLRIAMRVDDIVLRRYEGILRSKGDSAVAYIEDGACSGCYKSLPPQTLIEVKRAQKFIECDGCGRILYRRRETDDG
jgi:predicted  nucleic acid-binding Zn-ribbon protein